MEEMAARWMEKSLSSERDMKLQKMYQSESEEEDLVKQWEKGSEVGQAENTPPFASPNPQSSHPLLRLPLHTGDIFPQGLVCGVRWRVTPDRLCTEGLAATPGLLFKCKFPGSFKIAPPCPAWGFP